MIDLLKNLGSKAVETLWAHSAELPDALLLCEPKSAKDRDREFTRALESGETDSEIISALNTFDPAHVQVYREGDLQRARSDLEQAVQITFLTVVYLDGMFKGRIKPASLDSWHPNTRSIVPTTIRSTPVSGSVGSY
jgi:hypothetical protein